MRGTAVSELSALLCARIRSGARANAVGVITVVGVQSYADSGVDGHLSISVVQRRMHVVLGVGDIGINGRAPVQSAYKVAIC